VQADDTSDTERGSLLIRPVVSASSTVAQASGSIRMFSAPAVVLEIECLWASQRYCATQYALSPCNVNRNWQLEGSGAFVIVLA
jgi:hypothetical protein